MPMESPEGDFEQIAVGPSHACGIKADGVVTCWGEGTRGRSPPADEEIALLQVSVGSFHTCGTKPDKSVVCWGLGGEGYDADKYEHGQHKPPKKGKFVELSAGSLHTCGIKRNKKMVCWGAGEEIDVGECRYDDVHCGQAMPP